ncbi:helix-turn-helix domain-containing protein [Sulfitobacter sp. S190]|uniref:helix-turn-helix domain-containing protein n=1 Tax=Sulfitobacter sp. S190 TaxID=2867022 RepID=UPI0021A3D5F6|nr:AraC family transcriptional regulator [Sulfitobacter sp. S190]UWR24538.1 AraC family transcriptional regulator [Sulfitobacter sp. S190]
MDAQSDIISPAVIADFLRSAPFADCPQSHIGCLSAALITGDKLKCVEAGPFEILLIPLRPLKLSFQLDSNPERLLRLAPFTVCNLRPRDRLACAAETGVEIVLIAVERGWCNEICAGASAQFSGLSDVAEVLLHPEVPPLVQSIRRQLLYKDCPEAPFLRTYVSVLLSHLVWNNDEATAAAVTGAKLSTRSLNAALLRIDAEIDGPLRVSDLARDAGLSANQFSRSFKALVGSAPRDYILERRLHHAREMLEQTDDALCDIALAAGFSSQAHLTSMFAREFGMPPGQFRKLLLARRDASRRTGT